MQVESTHFCGEFGSQNIGYRATYRIYRQEMMKGLAFIAYSVGKIVVSE